MIIDVLNYRFDSAIVGTVDILIIEIRRILFTSSIGELLTPPEVRCDCIKILHYSHRAVKFLKFGTSKHAQFIEQQNVKSSVFDDLKFICFFKNHSFFILSAGSECE